MTHPPSGPSPDSPPPGPRTPQGVTLLAPPPTPKPKGSSCGALVVGVLVFLAGVVFALRGAL